MRRGAVATAQCERIEDARLVSRPKSAARGDAAHYDAATSWRRAAISSTRVLRESRSRHSGESSTSGRPPSRQRAWSSSRAARIAAGVVGRGDDAGAGLADQLRRGPVERDGGEDRTADRDVLEDLAREDALAPAAGVGDEEEQRLGVALERERLGPRRVRQQLEPIAELETRRPLPVGVAEVAEEAGDDVEAGVRERLEERARVAPPEEAPGVRDAEPLGRLPLEPGDVVEVGAVRDRDDGPARVERPRLLADRLRDARDRVGARGDEPRDTSCVAALALVAMVSARRWAWATSESRRSATQRTPVARAIAAAMRCVEGGGDVETTTSMPCSRTSRMPAGMAVTAHVAFSSGTTRRRSWSRAA